MSRLVEFLKERIDEDEAAARDAMAGLPTGEWTHDGGIYAGHPTNEVVDWVYGDASDHIARHDPARVLADCTARRRIIELHRIESESASAWRDREDGVQALVKINEYSCVICGWVMEDGPDPSGVPGCSTLIALVQPYSSHPDFEASWGEQQ